MIFSVPKSELFSDNFDGPFWAWLHKIKPNSGLIKTTLVLNLVANRLKKYYRRGPHS